MFTLLASNHIDYLNANSVYGRNVNIVSSAFWYGDRWMYNEK